MVPARRPAKGEIRLADFSNDTASWMGGQREVELELGVLIAAATDWTEDEMELDDLVVGLVESGRVRLRIG
jgi:hypothetical protein